jgi:UDP-N-acetylglucosamine 2-epimerase (non-hydrolysing)
MAPGIRILCVVGTRPEAIKMAPVINRLKQSDKFNCRLVVTAQHRDMLDQVLAVFNIKPDIDLDIMKPDQSLGPLTARLFIDLDRVLAAEKPQIVLAQGDTTTVMVAALLCYYNRIRFGHVEAGLRTGDIWHPFPEEINRVIAGRLARWHFAPTESARQNLLREGTQADTIHVTGNTVIDALMSVADQKPAIGVPMDESKRLILVTAHRRENFGEPLRDICRAITTLVERNPDIEILYPVHPNPNVQKIAHDLLGGRPRIVLTPALAYQPFVAAMQRAYLILSDSGGVQEEAPALGKPVLVMRRDTERPEAIDAGVVRLVGVGYESIVQETQRLLDDPAAYRAMARGVSPYGDGHAAERIVNILSETSL